jgi:hypothetical protein
MCFGFAYPYSLGTDAMTDMVAVVSIWQWQISCSQCLDLSRYLKVDPSSHYVRECYLEQRFSLFGAAHLHKAVMH